VLNLQKNEQMKNGLLVWNVLLTLLAGYLLVAHFSDKRRTGSDTKTVSNDTSRTSSNFRIAYFEMDSIEANYLMVKDMKAELSKKEDEINNELDQMTKQFGQRNEYFQNLARSGTLSQTQSENAGIELQQLKEKFNNRKAELDQEYGTLFTNWKKDVKGKIESYLKEFNKDKRYSFIASDDPGLFYYLDSAYNITGDLLKGLNATYKPGKSKKN
jgi:outer membrane protein